MGTLRDAYLNKNVLVTGGTGFVGSNLVRKLLSLGASVVCTYKQDNLIKFDLIKMHSPRLVLENLDVRDYNGLFNLITGAEIDYIFHLAAQPIVGVAYVNPKECLETNIMGTVNILEAARNYPRIKAIVVVTSDKAYGPLRSGDKYKESDPLKGDHPYDVSKSCADLIAHTYWKTYQLPVAIARAGNIYGEGDLYFSRIVPAIMKSFCLNQLLELRSNGKQVRDYLYVDDVVNGYLLMGSKIENIKGEAFNFGSEDSLSVIDLIRLSESVLGKKLKYSILDNAKNELAYQKLDDEKAKKMLGWKRLYTYEKVVKKIYKWYKTYFNE